MIIKFYLNGKETTVDVPPATKVVDLLREHLQLTGTKKGCESGECGACTIIVENKAVLSCLMYAPQLEGKHVYTIEGIAQDPKWQSLLKSFIENGAVQCGYCTPGMIASAVALLKENKDPTIQQIKEAISGNLCRCTGYQKIIKAIKEAVKLEGEKDDL